MEYRIRLNVATTAAVVALGFAISLITSTAVAARAYTQRGEMAGRSEQTLVAKGSTRKRITSDRAVWSIEVRGENAVMQQAFSVLESGIGRVREFLKSQGFGDAEIGLGAIETEIHYTRDAKGNETREVSSYSLSRRYWVTTREVQRVSRAAGEVTGLIRDGVLVVSAAPQYYYDDLPSLRVTLLGEASKDARTRAEEVARNAGCRVAEVRSAAMGVLQVTQPFSTEVRDGGIYDTSTIEKDVQAVVTVTFRVAAE